MCSCIVVVWSDCRACFSPSISFVSPVGARYISMSAYQASRDDEISFVSGAVVKLVKKYADGWWLVRYVHVYTTCAVLSVFII